MKKNRLKEEWSSGRGTLNGWLSINSAFVAEIMADQGFDSITVDMQHGALDYEGMLSMLQAVRASGVVPMVRVPWNHPPEGHYRCGLGGIGGHFAGSTRGRFTPGSGQS